MKVRKRHPLASRELAAIKETLERLLTEDQIMVLLAEPLEKAVSDSCDLVLSKGEPVVLTHKGRTFPALRGFLRLQVERRFLRVDMGAVPYVVKGADIMSPGIVAVDATLRKGDLCVVTEERHNKPLAIAEMLMAGGNVDRSSKGKVAHNIHHVGDDLWNIEAA